MRVLVTGGLGFIGQYVCERLAENGHSVLVMDRFKASKDCDTFLGDVRDRSSVMDAVSRVEGVVHLAGILGTQECVQNPYPAIETNILGGVNVLEALSHYKVPGVMLSLGNHWMNNTYSITKSTVDRFANMYAMERDTRVNVVRAVNAYGPGQKASAPYGSSKVRKVMPSFICRALADDPIEIYGDGDQFSDMVYAGDVAEALVRSLDAAARGVIFDCVVEVGPVAHNTVVSLAKRVKALTESKSEIVHLPMRPGEVPQDVTADTLTMSVIDMSAEDLLPISEGIAKTIEYYRA